MLYCGLDFGTSNTVAGLCRDSSDISFVPFDDGKTIIPSAIFFNSEEGQLDFGTDAARKYTNGYDGRLLRSLKSILGSSLIDKKTKMSARYVSFREIISLFLKHIKTKAEIFAGEEIVNIAVGRPVYFVDNNPKRDKEAEDTLKEVLQDLGYKNIVFQYEPIAASLDYENKIKDEELALIVDIGGGTSDFSIVKLSEKNHKKKDRENDILANHGVHIGGTDFDKALSLKSVMPEFGFKSKMIKENMLMPNYLYYDLSTWHRINLLYDNSVITQVKDLKKFAKQPGLIDRLIKVLDMQLGHNMLYKTENAKIDLTGNNLIKLDLSMIEANLNINITLEDFYDSIESDVLNITSAVKETIKMAGVNFNDINTLFFTGGSINIKYLKNSIIQMFENAKIVDNNKFMSVASGLVNFSKTYFS